MPNSCTFGGRAQIQTRKSKKAKNVRCRGAEFKVHTHTRNSLVLIHTILVWVLRPRSELNILPHMLQSNALFGLLLSATVPSDMPNRTTSISCVVGGPSAQGGASLLSCEFKISCPVFMKEYV